MKAEVKFEVDPNKHVSSEPSKGKEQSKEGVNKPCVREYEDQHLSSLDCGARAWWRSVGNFPIEVNE